VEVSETQAIKVAFKVGAAVEAELGQLVLMALVVLEAMVASQIFMAPPKGTRLADEAEREAMRLGTVE
jgi:hypothetical protein